VVTFGWQLRQSFVLPIPIFLAYLVPLDVDVTGNITANICEVWSEFNIFCTLVTMTTANILNLFNLVSLRVDFFQNGCRCYGNGHNAKKLKKHKKHHSRLLAEQKLMKLDRNNIHI
jgi:hypothetical protein